MSSLTSWAFYFLSTTNIHWIEFPGVESEKADTVIILRHFETGGSIRQAISVAKKRSGGHERTIREFKVTETGLWVGEPLLQFRGVLTGVPVLESRPEDQES